MITTASVFLPEVASHFPPNSFVSTFPFFAFLNLNRSVLTGGSSGGATGSVLTSIFHLSTFHVIPRFSIVNLSCDSSDRSSFSRLPLQAAATLFTNAGIKTHLIPNRSQQFSREKKAFVENLNLNCCHFATPGQRLWVKLLINFAAAFKFQNYPENQFLASGMLTSGPSCLDLPNLSRVTRNVNLGSFEGKSWVWWPEVKAVLACPVLLPYLTTLIWKCDKCKCRMFLLFVKPVSSAWSPKLQAEWTTMQCKWHLKCEWRLWRWNQYLGRDDPQARQPTTSDKLSLVIEHQHKCTNAQMHKYTNTQIQIWQAITGDRA